MKKMEYPNKERESLETVKSHLNLVGFGFCAAKWFTSTVWLSNGRTSSCHHPPAHKILDSDIEHDPSGLHNTAEKKQARLEMLRGNRPSECSYCWKVEDSNPDAVSDRYIKSSVIPWHDIYRNVVQFQTYPSSVLTIDETDYNRNFNPRILEISFDNLCNLKCSYCNSEFSSTWSNDLKKNGPYQNLKSEQCGTWEHAVEFDYNVKDDENKYHKAFFEWYNRGLAEYLQELRITGGEPLRSPHFWKFVNMVENPTYKFSINTNLMMDSHRLRALIECSRKFTDFDLYTSCEARGLHAEFIRSGLNYDQWLNNIREFATDGNYNNITMMLTINALSLFGITDFFDDMVKIKNEFNNKQLVRMSLNILRFPNFQSVNVLPYELKIKQSIEISDWLELNREYIEDGEAINIERLVEYLKNVDKSYDDHDEIDVKINDFVEFYRQYGERSGIPIETAFADSPDFIEWWSTIANKN